MPITKQQKKSEPLWKEWDYKAQKKGVHHTVYSVNGDRYTGEWDDNKKNGKGTMTWKKSGTIYDGDWKDDRRCGFGTYSVSEGAGYRKVYSGGWKNDKRHGYGTNFYSANEYYEGEWYADKCSGWGRMYYADGSVYEGEWYNDLRNGEGMLRLANENRYEGQWKDDKKHGKGRFFYLDRGQMYTGVWCDDIPKCGTVEDFGRQEAPKPTIYPLPECKLQDLRGVVKDAEDMFLDEQQ